MKSISLGTLTILVISLASLIVSIAAISKKPVTTQIVTKVVAPAPVAVTASPSATVKVSPVVKKVVPVVKTSPAVSPSVTE